MRKIFILALLPLLAAGGGQTVVNTGNHRKLFTVACNAPASLAGQWAAYNSANTCAGVACTNGATTVILKDMIGTNNADATGHSGTYVTGAINGLPAYANGSGQYLALGSALPNTGSMTFYAVAQTTAGTSTPATMFGVSGTGHGLLYAVAWNASPAVQYSDSQGSVNLGVGTTTLTQTVYHTLAMTYVFSTGAWHFYVCSGGTCASDNSGTTTSSFPNPTNVLGAAGSFGNYWNGQVAEWGYANVVSGTFLTDLATYSQCKYGI